MNINNNTLLNTLVKKLEPSVQAKIEKLSLDGKVDLSTLVQGKSIQTLLSGLFTDLTTGTKMKSDVSNMLETNKNILSPKNITSELKQVIDLVKVGVDQTVQVEKIVETLKKSQIDIKTLDAKILKNSIANSGVFLESKISQQNSSVIQNLSLLSTQLNSQLTLLQNILSDVKITSTFNNSRDSSNVITKEGTSAMKNNLLFDGFLGLKKKIFQIIQQVQNYTDIDKSQINKELNSIEQKINTLQSNQPNEQKIVIIKELLLDNTKLIEKINKNNIQELLKNNLGNIKNISEDLKVNLLLLKEIVEKSTPLESQNKDLKGVIEKTLSSIDYYQLSSFSSNANHSFLSCIQDELEDVDIKFNNQKDEFSCMVTLSLKEYGDLKVLLVLDDKNELSINIGVEQEAFKKMIQLSLQKLRTQINSLGLLLVNLNVFDIHNEKSDELKVYGSDGTIDFGLDMKV